MFSIIGGAELESQMQQTKDLFWHHRMLSKDFIHGESTGDFPVAMPALFSGCHVSNPLSTFDSLCVFATRDTLGLPLTIVPWSPPFL